MIPFKWNSITGKANLQYKISNDRFMAGSGYCQVRRRRGLSGMTETVFYLHLGSVYINVYLLKKSSSVLKIDAFYCILSLHLKE